ncbi:hypothetical protein UFOVP729_32 [uncultured Caudovirales phage]|jgi:hypothetical protein|uniref:Uncharacterized protein n=1 Tax=uncultured Caudovirales phage TaxID=2100421 RepID=A0A6J5NMT1_9CAUD|nr:hypothetical protein UFOVP729_32 [uncultured Caudovirales phage]
MISEVDINDMKALYDLDKGTHFKLAPTDLVQVPVDSNEFHLSGVYKFLGLDGMYSRSTDEHGNVHHFAAWTKVIPWQL